MTRYTPKAILSEFFRAEMDDPRGRHTNDTVNFSGDGSTKTFSFSSTNVQAIRSVSVGGTSKDKWADYRIDLKSQEITFLSAPAAGTDNISVGVKKGTTSWIYPDSPRQDLTASSYPRIAFQLINSSGRRLGTYEAALENILRVQTDIYTVRNQVYTFDGNSYEGNKLAEILGYALKEVIEGKESELHPTLYDFGDINGPRSANFTNEHQAWHSILEFYIKGINTGENL